MFHGSLHRLHMWVPTMGSMATLPNKFNHKPYEICCRQNPQKSTCPALIGLTDRAIHYKEQTYENKRSKRRLWLSGTAAANGTRRLFAALCHQPDVRHRAHVHQCFYPHQSSWCVHLPLVRHQHLVTGIQRPFDPREAGKQSCLPCHIGRGHLPHFPGGYRHDHIRGDSLRRSRGRVWHPDLFLPGTVPG